MIETLQGGRALAALAVCAYHLSITMGIGRYGGHAVFSDVTRFGDRGVDFFFVLSGFIILHAHERDLGNPAMWWRYLQRRFIRVYPIYWIYTLTFATMLALIGGVDAKAPGTFADWLTSLSLVRFTAAVPPLPVAWTLFHEVAFYAVFSLLILRFRVGVVVLTAFVLAALLLHQMPDDLAERNAWRVYTAAYNAYFFFGMCAYWSYRRGGKGWIEASLGLILVAISFLDLHLPPYTGRLILAAGFATALAGVTKLERNGWIRVPAALVLLGNASYTLYLIHVNVEGAALKILQGFHVTARIGPQATFLVVLVGTAVVGCMAYLLLERPLLNLLRRKAEQPRR